MAWTNPLCVRDSRVKTKRKQATKQKLIKDSKNHCVKIRELISKTNTSNISEDSFR